mgnify:CR=1 FL=1
MPLAFTFWPAALTVSSRSVSCSIVPAIPPLALTAPWDGGLLAALRDEALAGEGYIADERLATTVFLQSRLDKPLLLEGPAGVGKTELAKVLAAATGRRLLRLQCYEGQDESKALYEWDYGKQLLYTQILREKIGQLVEDAKDLEEAVDRIGKQESVFFSDRFLAPRPLLEAVRSEEPVVLLIDEIDRADEAFEAFLLEVLADSQVTIPELGTVKAAEPPIVILTSNRTREIHDALKRRCLYHWVEHPDFEREVEIVRLRVPHVIEPLARQVAGAVEAMRQRNLYKPPGVAETIDWASSLALLGTTELDEAMVDVTLGAVLKYREDQDKVRANNGLADIVKQAFERGAFHG